MCISAYDRVHLFSVNTSNARRRQVLSFIQSRLSEDGQSPSLEEIASACGLKSRSAAQKHVAALRASGELEGTPGKARSTRLKRPKPGPASDTPLFEVSPQDVADLSDTDLRELIARLCSAELAKVGLSPTAVVWGGDQRAPDGGIDVRVQLPPEARVPAGIPRAATGIQVKATRMGGREIQNEMCPGGLLRTSIQDLIRLKGAYLIAASDSVADGEYRERVARMRNAIATEPAHENAFVDYYDARRLADWANGHPGIVAWARRQVGRALQGWHPHGQWSSTRGGKPQPFIPDEKLRVVDPKEMDRKLSLADGLASVRNVLRNGGSSIRLTGLSGVGKTRFAQALFEDDLVPGALPPELAVYTDTSHSPNPPPLAVMDELLASGRRAALVIDNCPSQLHAQLTSRCKASQFVSLLTIEYDIREDLPSETNVFQLEPGSSDLIAAVIAHQYPHISQVNVATITRFADGNSRVALALASTVDRNQSLAGLTDRDLFERLFWLGKDIQHELMSAAEAASLVYSFNSEDLDGELALLAEIAGQSVGAMFRHIADLERRGLAQQRGVWRAVLPHAISNTLARRALESIPIPLIERNLVQGHDRLLRSFARRLGYLHDSPHAVAIVQKWLSEGGLLGDITSLPPLLTEVLVNVAPVSPQSVLAAIERLFRSSASSTLLTEKNDSRRRVIKLLRSIAYEPKYFDRCAACLLSLALAEKPSNDSDGARKVLPSLFSIFLSGTHATLRQRLDWVRTALHSSDTETEAIGRQCLASALNASHFTSHYSFDFGALSRDYGAAPRGPDVSAWFSGFISLAVEIGEGGAKNADSVRELLAAHFRELWSHAGALDSLEDATARLLPVGWEKGWLAIRQTISFDASGMKPERLSRLRALEEKTRPTTLSSRVKAVVLSGPNSDIDFADGEELLTSYERADQISRDLGELVAADADSLTTLLPLVVRNEQGRQWPFGEGLARGADNLKNSWRLLVEAFESTPADQRGIQVLRGFCAGIFARDPELFNQILDDALSQPSLSLWIPVLQLSAPLDERACARLLRTMENPATPAWVFQHLMYGGVTKTVDDVALSQLLRRLSMKPDGTAVAVEILSMRIHNESEPPSLTLSSLAYSLIEGIPLVGKNNRLDYSLKRLIEHFLSDPSGEAPARHMLQAIQRALDDYTLSRYDLQQTIQALFAVQPMAALDLLVGDDSDSKSQDFRRYELAGGRRSSALAAIPQQKLIQWCREGSPGRWAKVASLVPAFEAGQASEGLHWSGTIMDLLAQAPTPIEVAEAIIPLTHPTSWSGSLSETLRSRLQLIDELEIALGPAHAAQVDFWRNDLLRAIDREARRELDEYRIRDERFE